MERYYCSKCKEDISERVYNYCVENFDRILCRTCQEKYEFGSEETGLTEGESKYREGMIKGRIAETLVEELFLSLKYDVFRYGMENTVPGIMKLLRGVRGDVATNIRRMPDLVVKKDKKVFFVEVKFRSNEEFSFKDLPKGYPYENAYFIIVSKKHIKCITYRELKEGKEISPSSKNYLGNRDEFGLDKQVIIDFCDFATKFFQGV